MLVRLLAVFLAVTVLHLTGFRPRLEASVGEASRLQRLLRTKPHNTKARFRLVKMLLRARSYGPAIAQMEILLQDLPRLHNVRNKLGALLWRRGQRKEAVEQWRKVLEFQPTNKTALHYLKKAGVKAVESFSLFFNWCTRRRREIFEFEAIEKQTLRHGNKPPTENTSSLNGKLAWWSDKKKNQAGPAKTTWFTEIDGASVADGFHPPAPASFGLPPAGRPQGRLIDRQGKIHKVFGTRKDDAFLYDCPLFHLPEGKVQVGASWRATTTGPALYLDSSLGNTETIWTFIFSEVRKNEMGSIAVIDGRADHTFLDDMTIAQNLNINDSVRFLLDIDKHILTGFSRRFRIERRYASDKFTVCERSLSCRKTVKALKKEPRDSALLFSQSPVPVFIKPTEDEVRDFIRKFYDWIFFGHTEKWLRRGLDLENLSIDTNKISYSPGLVWRNTGSAYRAYLLSELAGQLDVLSSISSLDNPSPQEIAEVCKYLAESFTYYTDQKDCVVAVKWDFTFFIHKTGNHTRIFRVSHHPSPDGG